jgi:hypothetical protein
MMSKTETSCVGGDPAPGDRSSTRPAFPAPLEDGDEGSRLPVQLDDIVDQGPGSFTPLQRSPTPVRAARGPRDPLATRLPTGNPRMQDVTFEAVPIR